MTYKPTEYDLNWTRTLLGELKIGGVWIAPGPRYIVTRTGEKSVKISNFLSVHKHIQALIANIKDIGWTYELDDLSKVTLVDG